MALRRFQNAGAHCNQARLRVVSTSETGGSVKGNRNWAELMSRAQDGDSAAYALLLNGITPYLRSIALRYVYRSEDAEDVVQDILMSIHSARRTYDPQRPFAPWITAIARARSIDYVRRHIRTSDREIDIEPFNETYEAPDTNSYERVAQSQEVRDAVATLPAGQQKAIELLKFKELSLKEASAETGISVSALKVAVHRGMKNLRRVFADKGQGK